MCVSIPKINTVKCSHLESICLSCNVNIKACLWAAGRTCLVTNSWKYGTIIRGQSNTTFHSPSHKLHAGQRAKSNYCQNFPHISSKCPGKQRLDFKVSSVFTKVIACCTHTSNQNTAAWLCSQPLQISGNWAAARSHGQCCAASQQKASDICTTEDATCEGRHHQHEIVKKHWDQLTNQKCWHFTA